MTTPNTFIDDDDDVETGTDQSGSALRKFGKEQKKRADELERQFNELKAELAKRNAADIFSEMGINEKVRKFYTGEPTKDAIAEWWKENAELFGVEPAAGDPTLTEEQKQTQADLSGMQQLNQLGSEKQDALGREAISETRKGLMSNPKATNDDFTAALQKLGVPDFPLMAPQY